MTKIETLIAAHGEVIKRCCDEGWTIKRIAADLGYERKMVGRALLRMTGVPRHKGNYHYWLRERGDEIVGLYSSGASTSVIGKSLHVSPHTIAAVLRGRGVLLRRPGGVRMYSHATIIESALSGQSQTALAKQLGVSRPWLFRLEAGAGIPARRSPQFKPWCQRMLAERAREAA